MRKSKASQPVHQRSARFRGPFAQWPLGQPGRVHSRLCQIRLQGSAQSLRQRWQGVLRLAQPQLLAPLLAHGLHRAQQMVAHIVGYGLRLLVGQEHGGQVDPIEAPGGHRSPLMRARIEDRLRRQGHLQEGARWLKPCCLRCVEFTLNLRQNTLAARIQRRLELRLEGIHRFVEVGARLRWFRGRKAGAALEPERQLIARTCPRALLGQIGQILFECGHGLWLHVFAGNILGIDREGLSDSRHESLRRELAVGIPRLEFGTLNRRLGCLTPLARLALGTLGHLLGLLVKGRLQMLGLGIHRARREFCQFLWSDWALALQAGGHGP